MVNQCSNCGQFFDTVGYLYMHQSHCKPGNEKKKEDKKC